MAKKEDIVPFAIKFGLMGNYLPPFQLYIVYARTRIYSGYAVFGATTKKEQAYSAGWLISAKVYKVDTFNQYCERFQKNPTDEYNRLADKNLLPDSLGLWNEIEWGR